MMLKTAFSCIGILFLLNNILAQEIAVSDIRTTWVISKDHSLWLPQLQFKVKNTSKKDLERIVLKTRFIDEEGTITCTATDVIYDLPAGMKQGPVFLLGYTGYKSSLIFPLMKGNNKKWKYILYAEVNYAKKSTRIKQGYVEPPAEYITDN